jgi:hypothetical protein
MTILRGCEFSTQLDYSLEGRESNPLQTLDLRPGKPPESELDEARLTKVARVSARFSKSLARRQLRPNQEKVRSTTPRRGKTTKPFMSSLRLTISMRFAGIKQPEEFRTPAPAHVTAWRDDLASRALGGATVRLRLAAVVVIRRSLRQERRHP